MINRPNARLVGIRGRASPPPPERACPNCGTPVHDRFCPHCGQRNAERLVSLRRIAREVLEDQLSLEARLPRTLLSLLFRPGWLPREYSAGRIARYIPPFRLYLVASLLFFLVLSVVADFDLLWREIGPRVEAAQSAQTGPREAGQEFAVVQTGIDTTNTPGWLDPLARRLTRQEAKINALEPREGVRVVYGATLGNVPPVVFLMVPLFALLLKSLYRQRLYIEHLVFVLHLHALAFLLATVALLAQAAWLTATLLLWLPVYLFAALRRAYGESVPRTAAKYAVVVAGYFVALSVTLVAVFIVTILAL